MQLAAVMTVICLGLLAVGGRLVFLQQELGSAWRRLVGGTTLGGVLVAVVFYPVAGGGALSPDMADLWFPGLFGGHALLLIFLLVWWALRPVRPALMSLLPRVEHLAADLRYGLQTGLAGWLITIAVTIGIAAIAVGANATPPAGNETPAVMVWLAELPLGKKMLIIASAMVTEEAFFRGFLQRRVGLLLSSVLFALAHANYGLPFMMVSVLTISLVIGWALQQRGRLLPCVVAHGVFDTIQLVIIVPWAVRMMQDNL